MKKNFIILSLGLLIAASCAAKDPLKNLSEDHKNYVFGDDESTIVFLGNPGLSSNLDCNTSNKSQGYVINKSEAGYFIDSIRPSGVEKHKIKEINSSDSSITINAVNGADLPFSLDMTNINNDRVDISFNGETNSQFIRCIR